MKLILYTDGGARGNPGPAGIGAVLYKCRMQNAECRMQKNLELDGKWGKYIGEATNNQAEYQALILGLEKAKALKATEIECFLDSELVVQQLNRKYKVKDKDLAPLFVKVWNLSISFKKISFKYIPREKNEEADKLVNLAIDPVRSKSPLATADVQAHRTSNGVDRGK